MASTTTVRVRFAPAPTGSMHIGNIRTALMNVLYARQQNGVAVLRIEDTDLERNFDPQATAIQADLQWLGLTFDEGPATGGPYAPYFQSQRTPLYQKCLEELQALHAVYRCFCTPEELEKKRERQRALKLPPRYDRACTRLTESEIQERIAQNMPYIWRVMLPHDSVEITDLARGIITFHLKNFSDFPITRQDGSFTFIFANFVDDMLMKITHVFRGEDHLSNTACQAALYNIFRAPLPTFWHMPMITNTEGKKLSKRDFAFSVKDLQKAGFLPEAVVNYLGIIGSSYKDEIMDQGELARTINFITPPSGGFIKYDVEKLRWVNKQWIIRYDIIALTNYLLPMIHARYSASKDLSAQHFVKVIELIRADHETLTQIIEAIQFYIERPPINAADIIACIDDVDIRRNIKQVIEQAINTADMVESARKYASAQKLSIKELFRFMRLALMGATHGPSVQDLITILGLDESKTRLQYALNLLGSTL